MFLYNKLCKLNYLRAAMLSLGLICSTFSSSPLVANAADVSYYENISHVHQGSSQTGGGCYTVPVLHEHSDPCYRTYSCTWELKTHYNKWDEINDYTLVFVSDCGETHEQQGRLGDKCSLSDHGSHTELVCTHTGETDHYDLGCGIDSSQYIGGFAVVKSADEWAKSLYLFVAHLGDVNLTGNAYSVNGDPMSDTYITVTSNGTYHFHLNCDEYSSVADIEVLVDNIDNTAPTLNCLADTAEWTTQDIEVTVNSSDLQPDGSAGCGNITYSYDNGQTWNKDTKHSYSANGEYTIMARDMLENTAQTTLNISNIDREAPNLSIDYDKTANLAQVEITVTADDIMKSGQVGCGLDSKAYSFDGGHTWSEDNQLVVTDNGLVEISVRDKLGNKAENSIYISNIDNTAPSFSVSLSPDGWTNQPVEATIVATDENPDGSEGSGIAQNGYSYDGGRTWTDEPQLILSQNTNIDVVVKDNVGNTCEDTCVVENIDTEAPQIELSYTFSDNKSEACLVVSATDNASGLTDTPFKWNSGEYSSDNSITVYENGHYTVSVRDRAGNIAVKGADIENIVKPEPTKPVPEEEPVPEEPVPEKPAPEEPVPAAPAPEPEPVPVETPQPVEDPQPAPTNSPVPVTIPVIEPDTPNPGVPRTPVSKPVSEEIAPAPVITPVVIEKTIPEKPISAPKIVDTNTLPPKEKDDNSLLLNILMLILGILLLIALIFGLLFALSRAILIYCVLGPKKEKFVGITFAHKSKDAFEANISKSVIDSCDTTSLNLRFTMAFIYLHEEEDVTVYLPDKRSYIVKPDVNVKISL